MVERHSQRSLWMHFLINTPNIVATVNAAVAAAMAAIGLQAAEAPKVVLAVGGAAAFLLVWVTLYLLQRQTLRPFRPQTARFPTPPDQP